MHAAKPLFFSLLRLSGLSSEVRQPQTTQLSPITCFTVIRAFLWESVQERHSSSALQLGKQVMSGKTVLKMYPSHSKLPAVQPRGSLSPTTGPGCSKQQVSQQKSRGIKEWYSKCCQPHISEIPDSALLPPLPLQSWNLTILIIYMTSFKTLASKWEVQIVFHNYLSGSLQPQGNIA